MITVAILRAAGLSADQIVRVLELEQEAEQKLAAAEAAERRERERIRKREQRARPKLSVGHDGTHGTPRDIADPPKERKEPKERNTPPDPSGLRPSAPAAPAALTRSDLEREFFNRGKQVLGKNAGGLLTGLLKAKEQDIALARSALELAATKADPREFVAAACKTNGYHATGPPPPRPGSREDRAERTANAMRILREQAYPSADDGRGGKAPGDPTTGLLPFPKSP